jgi:transcriptional regulator with XRE-family HTH domain
MIYPIQVRAARALLGLSQEELAERASIGIMTVKRVEAAGAVIRGSAQTMVRIQRALEKAGVVFEEEDADRGPGVRLRRPLAKQ